jgi:predicted MFS family arabinose efflux permease
MAIALGPIVGGWLLEQFSWTSIFFAMAPVAAVAAALVAWSVPTSRDPGAHRTDGPGLVLSSAAIALLTYTLIEAPNYGWSAGRSLTGYALAAALFAAFILRERTVAEPMLDVSLFRNLRFTAASGSVTIAFFGISGFSFLITQYFQFFKGYHPLSTGVHLLPVAFAVGIMSVLGTQLAVRFGTKQVVTVGLFCLAAFFAWVSTARTGTSYLEIAGQMVLGGSGVGLVSAPATEAIMGVVPKAKAGIGSAVNDATRLLGSTLGVAVIGSVYASLYNSRLSDRLPAELAPRLARTAHDPVGGALALPTARASTATPHSRTPSTPPPPTRSSTASAPPASSPQASAQWPRSPPWCCSQPIPQPG